ncbi:bifunctional phosphopantothenoylcysteine decarboxylase/phosphopantothenate--cysteine ligase CoaBC [Erysipelotrichaceae bacterium RD49]|nr:bifunctional phosphopantothenoylcysteine decarboxylase/phosphopantothenate--cysteine ligase CoaBC [Erysipelotrichaceae bacterium RD49]
MESAHILIGLSGSIAAFKIASLVSSLTKQGYEVRVIETKHAAAFLGPLTLAALSHHDVYTDEFNGANEAMIPHIALSRWADLFLIAPADANILAKAACGIADDLLSSTILAATCPMLAAPAMNVHMFENIATQNNLKTLHERGWHIIDPAYGMLACQEAGQGRMAEPADLEAAIKAVLAKNDASRQSESRQEADLPLQGKRVVVSAGPTQESLDPVRFMSNHSSGKQGYAIAKAARDLGATVTLVSGPVTIAPPEGVEVVPIVSALDLEKAMLEQAEMADFIIMAAAVADYRFKDQHDQKMKKSGDTLTLELVKNPDILAHLGANKKTGQILCGFAMETENLDANARIKLESKNCDMLVANNLHTKGAGFQTDTNIVSLLFKDRTEHLDLQTKEALGHIILKTMLSLQEGDSVHAALR